MRPLGTGQRDGMNVPEPRHGKLCQTGAGGTPAGRRGPTL